MKKMKTTIVMLILIVTAFAYLQTFTEVRADQQNNLKIVNQDDNGLKFNVEVPWQQIVLEEIEISGTGFLNILMQDWTNISKAGEPSLPYLSFAIGAPENAQIYLDVTPGKFHTIDLNFPILPSETPILDRADPSDILLSEGSFPLVVEYLPESKIYEQDAFYPGVYGKVDADGYMRQQRIIGVGLYPLQYNPKLNQLVIYETLDVQISFSDTASREDVSPMLDSDVYEEILAESLLNYEQALSWRVKQPEDVNENLEIEGETLEGVENGAIPWAPPNPGWRIAVKEKGFYKLTYDELAASQVPVETVDPSTFQLFNLGEEVSIEFLGDTDSAFESSESILFFGESIENKYSEENIYWLTFEQENGKRIGSRDVSPESGESPPAYDLRIDLEENNDYIPSSAGDDALERFMWTYLSASTSPVSWTHTINLPSTADGSGILRLELSGVTSLSAIDPDHHVRVYLDNAMIEETLIGEDKWDGRTRKIVELLIPAGYLADGENHLRIECPGDTGGSDVYYIDKLSLVYQGNLEAVGNQYTFSIDTPGTWLHQIEGLTSPPQGLFDIRDTRNIEKLTGYSTISNGDYSILFEDTISENTSYWALGEGSVRNDEVIIMDQFSEWQSRTNRADYIIITPEVFETEAQSLADHRSGQGLWTQMILLQDIYDEFNFGITDVKAVYSFLKYAYDYWQTPKPSYVVLVGDGNYDPKNYMGYGRTSYFPPYLHFMEAWKSETATDNQFVLLSGEDLMPDMMIGRLSVNSTSEAQAFVDKIIAYETNPDQEQWQQTILAVADNADSGGNFDYYSDMVMNNHVPSDYAVERVYLGINYASSVEAKQAILDAVNQGNLIVNYFGHGSYYAWAEENLLRHTDIDSLINGRKTPIILAMTCLDGFFHYPYLDREVIPEVFTRADNRGAVAAWSPTEKGLTSGHFYLSQGFYDAIFKDGKKIIGKATLAGKLKLWITNTNLDLLDTYTLFGDPATKLPLPEDEPYMIYLPIILE